MSKSLRDCKTVQEAMPLVADYGPAMKKLVETAMLLKSHSDPIQQQYGESFLNSAIQEMDAAEEPVPKHNDFVKPKGEHFVKEELLPGGNQDGNAGSEQSTRTKGTTNVAGTSPEDDTNMSTSTGENQFSEAFPQMMPGLDPSIAGEMGRGMPGLPQMNTNQMIRQMQYTVKKAMEAYVVPLRNQIVRHQEAIKSLSNQLQETKAGKSAMALDMGKIAAHAPARNHIQETIESDVLNFQKRVKNPTLEDTRHEMYEMDKMLSNTPYQ